MSDQLWFHARRYGWGWEPVTWQGWVAMAIYLALLLGWLGYYIFAAVQSGHEITIGLHFVSLADLLPPLALTAVFLAVCWIKGERPRWRWGK